MSDQTSTSLNTRTSRSASSSTSSRGSSYRLESVGEPEVEEMVVPSLGLEELEGRIHSYEGPLEYRALGKLGALKGWKKRWFRIAADNRRSNVYHVLKSKSTVDRISDVHKRLLTVPKSNPNIFLNTFGEDPSSRDFMSFNVCDSSTGADLCMFRAENIVQQRNFMAALCGKGPGLFTQNSDDSLEITMLTDGPPTNELFTRRRSYDSRSNRQRSTLSTRKAPTYVSTMTKLSREFYLPEGVCQPIAQIDFPGEQLPVYQSLESVGPTSPRTRRPKNDTFLPPHGDPVHSPVSLGYGTEVGLEPCQQAIWVPQDNFYYFLDHERKTSFLQDPRPPSSPAQVINQKQLPYTGSVNVTSEQDSLPDLCKDAQVITATSTRAAMKPAGLILEASGADGLAGSCGRDGERGANGEHEAVGIGFNHTSGADGSNGFPGTVGQTGSSGTCGKDGNTLILNVSGDATKLKVTDSLSMSTIAKLGGDNCEYVMIVDCHGGDGGDGGDGGVGGDGGAGGDGGRGGPDGDGGHGGDGGMGGTGGHGGAGGNAGNGGACVIQTQDPRLLMLVEVNCEAGKPGKGGTCGKSGEGGTRGFGGDGGPSSSPDGTPPSPRSSSVGLRGKPGMTGSAGNNGRVGDDGKTGSNGGILWVIQSNIGKVLHEAGTRYDAEITSLTVTPGVNDGVYEPNQRISIEDVVVKNSGGLPLPEGCKLFFPSSETIRFEDTVYTLPEIPPNQTFSVPFTFCGRIFDLAPVNEPGPFSTEASFTPRVELLGRPFEKSSLEKNICVTYPIKLPFALSRSNVSRGEVTTLDIGIENTSNVTYGSCPDSYGSALVRVHMDARLIPIGVIGQSSSDENKTHNVTFDSLERDSLFIEVNQIKPGETVIISFAVQMDPLAELCDTCVWQAVLYFKGKRIEYRSKEIRISPAYSPPSEASQLGDILMVTSDSISREQFLYWQKIFEILSVSVDFWDANYRKTSTVQPPPPYALNGIASPQAEPPKPKLPQFCDLFSGKVILYPHCDLDQLPAREITQHFHGEYTSESLEDKNSSMLLFLKSSFPESLEDYTNQLTGQIRLWKHLCSTEEKIQLPEDAYTGLHLISPGTFVSPDWSMMRSRTRTMKTIQSESPTQSVALIGYTNKIRRTSRVKYQYGSMDVRRVPLLKSVNFQCVDCTGRNYIAMGTDDPLLTPSSREFPLGSNFAQVLLAVLSSLPLRCKLNILKKPVDKTSPNYVKFHLPNGLTLGKRDLSAICIASDVTDELFNCPEVLTRMTTLCENVTANRAIYIASGVIPQLIELIKQEVKERQQNGPAFVLASRELLCLCDSLAVIVGEECCKKVSLKLPLLKTLQDKNSVLRCHQHSNVCMT